MKYNNKDGIELSYEGHENDFHVNLIKEVISESIKLIDIDSEKAKKFLTENFALDFKNRYSD